MAVEWPPRAFGIGTAGLIYRVDPDKRQLRPSLLSYKAAWSPAEQQSADNNVVATGTAAKARGSGDRLYGRNVAFTPLAAPPRYSGAGQPVASGRGISAVLGPRQLVFNAAEAVESFSVERDLLARLPRAQVRLPLACLPLAQQPLARLPLARLPLARLRVPLAGKVQPVQRRR